MAKKRASIKHIFDNVGANTGKVDNNARSDDRKPTLVGELNPELSAGETLHIYSGSSFLGNATFPNKRNWRFTPSFSLPPGRTHSFTARVADAAGNLGKASKKRVLILDKLSPFIDNAALTHLHERPTSQSLDIASDSIDVGPLKRYGEDRYNESLEMEKIGRNKPKSNPEVLAFFDKSIPQKWNKQLSEWMKILIQQLGGYDRFVHVLWDINETRNKGLLKGLDSLGFFYDDEIGKKVRPSVNFVAKSASCLSGFGANGNEHGTADWSICNQPNPFTDPFWEYDRVEYFENGQGFKYAKLNEIAHEYFHHVQKAHELAAGAIKGNDNDLVKPPQWYTEGAAQIIPIWLLRDNFSKLSLTKKLGLTYRTVTNDDDDPLRNGLGSGRGWVENTFKSEKEEIIFGGKTCAAKEETYDGKCDEHLMATYLMYITSPQVALVDIMEDQWELGFEGSFAKHVGLTLDQFYEEYNHFMKQGRPEDTPPVNYFVPPKPLSKTVDFWNIDSGVQGNDALSTNSRRLDISSRTAPSIKALATTTPFDDIIGSRQFTEERRTRKVENFTIKKENGDKIIQYFDVDHDQISFFGHPAAQLNTCLGDTNISEESDLEATIMSADDSQLILDRTVTRKA